MKFIKDKGIIIFAAILIGILILGVALSVVNLNREMDPVLWAIVSNEPNCLREELEKGADVDEMGDYEMTSNGNMENNPLRIAADNRSDDCFNILLEYGANVNYIDKENDSLLMYTAGNCDYSKFQSLLDNGADITYKNNGKDIMQYAVTAPYAGFGYDEKDATKIINKLSELGLTIKADYLMSLLEEGYVPSIESMKALQKIHNDYLSGNIEIEGIEECILNDICTNNANKIINHLRKDTSEFYIIGLCVAYNNVDALDYYYNQGGDLNIISTDGAENNLLMVAAAFNSKECLEILLDNGVPSKTENGIFMTAIDYAEKYNNEEALQLLK